MEICLEIAHTANNIRFGLRRYESRDIVTVTHSLSNVRHSTASLEAMTVAVLVSVVRRA